MPPRHVVVIGASAGGVEALSRLVKDLTPHIPAAIFVTIHFPSGATSALARILQRSGTLEAIQATEGERIEESHIYIAPPDHHLLIGRDTIDLYRGPRENGNRPAIDPMFRSAALAFGPRVIGVVLSGNLEDGTSGLLAIKRRGGTTVAQDPDDAMFPSMPQSAIDHAAIDHVVKLDDMGALLNALTEASPPSEMNIVADDAQKETNTPSLGESIDEHAPAAARDR